jgi:uncharacterized protein YdhG (YjbR/CyaY superfamily)
MPEKKNAKKASGFSAEEKAAMRERSRELKASSQKEQGESEVLAKIADMAEPDRSMALKIHAIVKEVAPKLSSRMWYGMPAYTKDGHVLFFFQNGRKFKTRYSTLGFSDKSALDDGLMWPSAYALSELTQSEEERIKALIRKAVG